MSKLSQSECLATTLETGRGHGQGGGGSETIGVRSFLVRTLLTALPDDIIRASGWLSRQIAARASLTNTASSLISV